MMYSTGTSSKEGGGKGRGSKESEDSMSEGEVSRSVVGAQVELVLGGRDSPDPRQQFSMGEATSTILISGQKP